jgi:CRISPR-associated protein Cmr1
MARLPSLPAPALTVLGAVREPLFDLTIKVVTPLFGGSPIARETDPSLPIRAASVRGQLRFWWRACKGAQFSSPAAMFEQEERIWGSVDEPGKVAVLMDILDRGNEVPAGVRVKGRINWTPAYARSGYALFPFQGDDREKLAPAVALENVIFRLRITLAGRGEVDQALSENVEAALWAWLTFGGVGARTRRGCGSLYCADSRFAPPSRPTEIGPWLQQMARHFVARQPNAGARLPIPLLHGGRAIVLANTQHAPLASWNEAVGLMQAFRQVPNGRTPGKVPGASRWPEANSIRSLNDADMNGNHLSFPRADLGLPIVFQFKGATKRTEPGQSTLQAVGETARMASPIILKPLAFTPDESVPLVLCLTTPHVWDPAVPGLEIAVGGRGTPIGRDALDPQKRPVPEALRDLGTGSAREGFLRYVLRRHPGNKEVIL